MSSSIQKFPIDYFILQEEVKNEYMMQPLEHPNIADVKAFDAIVFSEENINAYPVELGPQLEHSDVVTVAAEKIRQVQNVYQNNIQQIHGLLDSIGSDKLNTSDLVKLQLKVNELTLSLEVASKITNKIPQSVETLMRG